MAPVSFPGPPETVQKKIQETRERFRSEYAPDAVGRYLSSDVERLLEDDASVERYLEWRHYVVEDALKMIDESLQWRKGISVNEITESCLQKSFLESGMHYIHGYDKEGNKLFWFRVKLHVKDAPLLQEKKKYVAFWLERFVRREPAAVLTAVFDMSESGLSNVDMDFMKFIINCLEVYYPKLVVKIIVFELPWIMNAAWKIVKTWLGPDAIDRLKFVSRSDVQTYIEAGYLPHHMGGTDAFEYSYPPLPDDHFQAPMSESPDQGEDVEKVVKESEEPAQRTRKVCFAEEGDVDPSWKVRPPWRPSGAFKGSLLHISPAGELCFGLSESEKRCLIVLNNVTKNTVAYKVRTTAPEKYRVKPSNSSCEPGASVEITVSLHGGSLSSPQDRFLIMAAEMDAGVTGGNQDLAQLWKEIPKAKVMEHRLQCCALQGVKPASILANHKQTDITNGTSGQQDTNTVLLQLLAGSRRLEQKLDRCLWTEKVLVVMVTALTVLLCSGLYLQPSGHGLW